MVWMELADGSLMHLAKKIYDQNCARVGVTPRVALTVNRMISDWNQPRISTDQLGRRCLNQFVQKKHPKIMAPELPVLYHQYLMNLVGYNKESYEYVLDWLATAYTRRNLTFLCLIGAQGVGKTVLGDLIAAALFGQWNAVMVDSKTLTGSFNAEVLGKRLVFIDEMHRLEDDQKAQLKLFTNETLNIKEKFKTPYQAANTASYIIASNDYRSLPLESRSDRRFSVITLGETNLLQVMSNTEIQKLYRDDEMVAQLANYLEARTVTRDMNSPFVDSESVSMLLESGLSEAAEHILTAFYEKYAGKTVAISELVKQLRNSGIHQKFGRGAFKDLAAKFPNLLRVSVRHVAPDLPRQWVVMFLKDGEAAPYEPPRRSPYSGVLPKQLS